jgi:branched-chain amino acid aminotransferase
VLDVVTPLLDSTILPGVTHASVLSLVSHHPLSAVLLQQSSSRPHESGGNAVTATAVAVAARVEEVRRKVKEGGGVEVKVEVVDVEDIELPVVGGEGSVAQMLWEWLVDIQEGHIEWEGWGVPCDEASR